MNATTTTDKLAKPYVQMFQCARARISMEANKFTLILGFKHKKKDVIEEFIAASGRTPKELFTAATEYKQTLDRKQKNA